MSKIITRLNLLRTFASHRNESRASFVHSTFRPLTFGLLLIFHFSFFTFHSCGLDIEDPTPPSPPVWVQKSLPEEWPERGIDAHESGGIYLEWEPNLEEDVTSYYIYRAHWNEDLGGVSNYTLLLKMGVSTYPLTEYIDTEITEEVRYFVSRQSNSDKIA